MRGNIIKDTYSLAVGAAWILSLLGALYFLARALFFGGWWMPFLGTALLCWVLYSLLPQCWAQTQKLDDWIYRRRARRR